MKKISTVEILILSSVILIPSFSGCEEADIPFVETSEVREITTSSALCIGEIHCDGNSRIIEKGVCWSLDQNPLKDDNHLIENDREEIIEFRITGLEETKIYYARAYASNRHYTGYGDVISFATGRTVAPPEIHDSFTDARDGNEYGIVKIGDQWWMAENLAYLPSVSPTSISSYKEPVYYVYGYEGSSAIEAKATENYITYGSLYNWTAAMDDESSSDSNPSGVQGVCPDGWHLPSDSEWKELEMFMGMSPSEVEEDQVRGYDEGGMLKAAGQAQWFVPNSGATNETYYTALPGGRALSNRFNGIGGYGFWRSSTTNSTNNTTSWTRCLGYPYSNIGRGQYDSSEGHSVRCVKD